MIAKLQLTQIMQHKPNITKVATINLLTKNAETVNTFQI